MSRKLLEQALDALEQVTGLIGESHGVTGLHLNGDVAPWEELLEGGQYERFTGLYSTIEAIKSELAKPEEGPAAHIWLNGYPTHPWDKEWFIAQTTSGERVVLKALPKEYSYDFKTADETYIKKENIARWMQFPDSEYAEPPKREPLSVNEIKKIWMNCETVGVPNFISFARAIEKSHRIGVDDE